MNNNGGLGFWGVVGAVLVFFFIQHLSAGIRSMVIFAASRN